MLSVTSLRALFIIAGLVALGPLSTDMYLPALPAMRRAFAASVESIQLTLSLYLIGFALAQLFCGPLADRFGRKPVIVSGMILFLLATVGCAFATSIEEILVLRVVQAVGACVGPVLGRTMVRDVYGPAKAVPVLSYLASIMAVAPAVAPILGGLLLARFDWPSVFIGLAVFALIIALFYSLLIPETLAAEHKQSIQILPVLRNFKVLLHDRIFLSYTLCGSLGFAGLFTYISGAPFVLIEYFKVPEAHFGYYFFLIVLGYIGGSFLSGRLGNKVAGSTLLFRGCALACACAAVCLLLPILNIHNLTALLIPATGYAAALGLIMPQSTNGALKHYPHMAGTASSLLGFTQMGTAAVAGMVFGQLHRGDDVAMNAIIGVLGVSCLLCYWFVLPSSEKRVEG
jgi:DHA1 family bicyclomycin/chloramphenicol resistance-like MFS transporter